MALLRACRHCEASFIGFRRWANGGGARPFAQGINSKQWDNRDASISDVDVLLLVYRQAGLSQPVASQAQVSGGRMDWPVVMAIRVGICVEAGADGELALLEGECRFEQP